MSARTLQDRHFALLDTLVRRMADTDGVDETARRAVTALTASADPARADRLAVRPGEPAVLVERLAAWALRRASDDAVARARRILDGHADVVHADVTSVRADDAVLAAC